MTPPAIRAGISRPISQPLCNIHQSFPYTRLCMPVVCVDGAVRPFWATHMKIKIPVSAPSPAASIKARLLEFRAKTRQGVSQLRKADDEARQRILAFAGIGGRPERPLASDTNVLRWMSSQLVRDMVRHRAANPNRRYFLITIADELGFTSDRAPLVPLREIEGRAWRLINKHKLNAIGVIEGQPLANYPGGGEGRSILYHVHLIAWSTSEFDHNRTQVEMNRGRTFSSPLGAIPILIQPVADTAEDLARVAAYLIKAPHSAKNRVPNPAKPGEYRLMDNLVGYRPEFALRMLEGLSQIELPSLIFGVREGTGINTQLRRALMKWHAARPADEYIVPSDFDVWQFWADLRRTVGSDKYQPYRFDRLMQPSQSGIKSAAHATRRKSAKTSSRPRAGRSSKANSSLKRRA